MSWHARLDDIAKRLRSQQVAIIASQNGNSRQKKLRSFSSREAAGMLGITEGHLRNRVSGDADGFPQGTLEGKNRTFTLEDIHAARNWLHVSTGNARYRAGRLPGDPACVLAMTNFKGGVGKSTTTVHLAQYLALKGYRVLIIDLDAQASTTALFGIDPARQVGLDAEGRLLPAGSSIHGWINRAPGTEAAAAADAIRPTYWPNIDLVAATAALHASENALTSRATNGLQAPLGQLPFHRELQAFVAQVSGEYDVVLCDCRPDINNLTVNAFVAADALIVPVLATNMDLQSMTEFLAFLGVMEQRLAQTYGRAPDWRFIRVLVNRFVSTSRPQMDVFSYMNLTLGDLMIQSPMVETSALGSAGNLKWTLYEYEPLRGEDKSQKRAIAAMNAVGSIIEAEILGFWGRKPEQGTQLHVAAE